MAFYHYTFSSYDCTFYALLRIKIPCYVVENIYATELLAYFAFADCLNFISVHLDGILKHSLLHFYLLSHMLANSLSLLHCFNKTHYNY